MAEEVKGVKLAKIEPNGSSTEAGVSVAQDAVEGTHTQTGEMGIRIEPVPPVPQQVQGRGPIEDRKLFIGGLSSEINKESLTEFFEGFGPVEDVDIKADDFEPTHHKGFAFVVMADAMSVVKILDGQNCKRHKIGNRYAECKKALSQADYQAAKHRSKKVFVGGVPTDLAKEILEEYFVKFGEIEEVILVTERGEPTRRKGFVFVHFKSYDSADACMAVKFHTVHGHKLEVKKPLPRDNPIPVHAQGHGYPRRRGGSRDNWAPYGNNSWSGGYGGYSEPYYDDYSDPGYYDHPPRGGWRSGFGPVKGNPRSRGFHPYGRY